MPRICMRPSAVEPSLDNMTSILSNFVASRIYIGACRSIRINTQHIRKTFTLENAEEAINELYHIANLVVLRQSCSKI